LTGVDGPELVVASHIVDWAAAPAHRVDPANGLCLNRLHDAAFDKKLITFDEDFRLLMGLRIRRALPVGPMAEAFERYDGVRLAEPIKHLISQQFLAQHRATFFRVDAA